MNGAGYRSRLRGARGVLLLCGLTLVVFPLAAALILIGLAGIVMLVAGLFSWLHPTDLAAAWGRTLTGLGLIGGSVALLALGWLAIGTLIRRETSMNRKVRFLAVLGILLVLICLPFGAAIRASAGESWLGGTSWFGDDDSADSGRIVTRDFSWDGGDRLELDISGQVRFRPAPTWHLTIRGREGTLDRLLVADGRIREKDHGLSLFGLFGWHHHGPVQIDFAGPRADGAASPADAASPAGDVGPVDATSPADPAAPASGA